METVDEDQVFEILIKYYPGKIVTHQTFRVKRDDIQCFRIYDSEDILIKDLLDRFQSKFYKRKDLSHNYFELDSGFLSIDDHTDIDFGENHQDVAKTIAAKLTAVLDKEYHADLPENERSIK
jgi:hypothetical protein